MAEIIIFRPNGFIPKQTYQFNPPLLRGWTQKHFAEGKCIAHKEGTVNTWIFLGNSVEDGRQYFFLVEYGSGGSVATEEGQ
jgi:hypothetical protein